MTARAQPACEATDDAEVLRRPRASQLFMLALVGLLSPHTVFGAELKPKTPSATHAQTKTERTPSLLSRDAVWRNIFARPLQRETEADLHLIALGEALFFDGRLSQSGKTSCGTCHQPTRGFTDGRATSVGPTGVDLNRNVPTLFNLADARALLWDGSVKSLEDQARGPILAASEMNTTFNAIVMRLSADPETKTLFKRAFPRQGAVTEQTILKSLAAYERSLVSPLTRFDAWVAGDDTALSEAEKAGFAIFVGKGGCVACHGGWRFTDDTVHDIGLPRSKASLRSQTTTTKRPAHGTLRFKTPTLRELTRTAPYMHDGSKTTLADVINHYTTDIERRPSLALQLTPDLQLTGQEKRQLELFLKTLSSEIAPIHSETTRPMIKN